MTGPADLLEELDADEAVVLSARLAVLLERGDRRRFGRRHDFDVGHRVGGGIGWRVGAGLATGAR